MTLKIKKYLIFTFLLVAVFSYKPVFAAMPPEDGFYEVPVILMHADKDKKSMGANGLQPEALAKIEQGHLTLYLRTQMLSVTGLTTSMWSCHYLDGMAYRGAAPLDYSLELPKTRGVRPQAFRLTFENVPDRVPVLVNPQVLFMGNVPLAARLAINWQAARPLADDGSIAALEEGRVPNGSAPFTLSASGLSADLPGGFQSLPDLAVTLLPVSDKEKYQAELNASEAYAWKVQLFQPLDRIPAADKNRLGQLRKECSADEVSLYLPKIYPQCAVYRLDKDGLAALTVQDGGDQWLVHSTIPGNFIMVPYKDGLLSSGVEKGQNPLKKSGQQFGQKTATSPVNEAMGRAPLGSGKTAAPLPAAPGNRLNAPASGPATARPAPLSAGTELASGDDQGSTDDETAQNEPVKERNSAAGVIAFIFAVLIGGAAIIGRRTYPLFKNELDRWLYLRAFERRLDERENRH